MSRAKTQARVFVPLMKVDEEQRLVFGKITAQELDQSGEMMDYDTSKPNFEKWSAQIEAGSGGLSKGNLRVMHGLSVAGKLTDLAFNDDDKSIEVCAKVVDDGEWNKVIEGCYTGFSVGGKYGKKWKETIDGETITKFTAIPNEVSIVDNPCVKSATFALVKADGATEEVMFKAVQETGTEETPTKTPEATETPEAETVEKNHELPVVGEPSATAIAEKAGELAKAAGDNSTWQDHIAAARDELMKTSALQLAAEQEREARTNDATGEVEAPTEEADPKAAGTGDPATGDDASDLDGGPAEKVTPPGLMQKWECSDGKTFEKKADAEAHEATLAKAAEPKTDAEALRDRLNKALNPEDPVETDELLDDLDRMAKVFNVIETLRGGTFDPEVMKKGMYTVSQFSYVMSDLNRLSKRIAEEGIKEGGDETDAAVADDIKAAIRDLGKSFKTYTSQQVDELLAGLDDEVIITCYDYYCAARETGEDQLAKDVCTVLESHKDSSRERRDVLAKAFVVEEQEVEVDADELTPPMQKRFDALEAENTELKKLAGEAVEKVEEFAARLKKVEDTPLPRAPRNVALKPGDNTFLGKTADTAQERIAIIHDELKARGPDAVATDLIKLAQANPIPLVTR